jgi:hypothetical protein
LCHSLAYYGRIGGSSSDADGAFDPANLDS